MLRKTRKEKKQFEQSSIETSQNAIFPRVLETGDEIGPAMYALMRKANRSIRLQTYFFYEKSESAKWLHRSIDELQKTQRAKKANGEKISPISVEITLDDSRGVAKHSVRGNGGLFQKAKWVLGLKKNNRHNKISRYGIGYPSKVDPELVKITVKGLKHYARGSLHSKSLLVDDKYSLVSTNNLKGTHHKISMDGEARFDAGLIFSGEASQAIRDELIAINKRAGSNIIGSNASEKPMNERTTDAYSLPLKYHPSVYSGEIKPWELMSFHPSFEMPSAQQLMDEIDTFKAHIHSQKHNSKMVVISKAPANVLYTRIHESAQRAAFMYALNNAQKFIRIAHTNLNVPEVIDALVEATNRNVVVEILLPDDSMEIASAVDAKTNCQSFYQLQQRVAALGKKRFSRLTLASLKIRASHERSRAESFEIHEHRWCSFSRIGKFRRAILEIFPQKSLSRRTTLRPSTV